MTALRRDTYFRDLILDQDAPLTPEQAAWPAAQPMSQRLNDCAVELVMRHDAMQRDLTLLHAALQNHLAYLQDAAQLVHNLAAELAMEGR